MISRRIVVQGFAALTAGLAWRPALGVSRASASVPVAVSPDMVSLACLWEAIGMKYDETKHRTFTSKLVHGQSIDTECADYKRWRRAEQRLIQPGPQPAQALERQSGRWRRGGLHLGGMASSAAQSPKIEPADGR